MGMVYNISHNPGLGESDHTCIHFTLNCYGQDVIKENKPNYFKANYETIRERLRQVNWGNELHGDFSNAYKNFTKVLDTSLEGCVPNYKSYRKVNNIYLTREAVRIKNRKNKLWRKYTKSRSVCDKTQYNRVKNELRSLTRRLRKEFETDLTKSITGSPKTFWSYIKSKMKTTCKIPPLKNKDKTEATTPKEKAETLNTSFSGNFTDELSQHIPNDSEDFVGEFLDSFVIHPDDVMEKI